MKSLALAVLLLATTLILSPTVLSAQSFLRGDADGSFQVQSLDAVAILDAMMGGTSPVQADAADTNDNGVWEVSDSIMVMDMIFGGYQQVPAPFPTSGLDTTPMATFPPAQPSPSLQFSLTAPSAPVAPGGLATFTLEVTSSAPLRGWQLRIVHDPALMSFVGLDRAPLTLLLGTGGDSIHTHWQESPGALRVLEFRSPFYAPQLGADVLPAGADQDLYELTFQVAPTVTPGTALTVEFEDLVSGGHADFFNLASPWDLIMGGHAAAQPVLATGVGASLPVVGSTPFVRGDANGDGAVNIADAVTLLLHLFPNGSPALALECLDASDINVSGTIDIADPIHVLFTLHIFGSIPIPPPYPGCGVAPLMGCSSYANCP